MSILSGFSSLEHPNIIKMLGYVVYHDNSVGIVMDFMRGGELKKFLKDWKMNEVRILTMQHKV